jgi:Domain of unknown function (DUF4267)
MTPSPHTVVLAVAAGRLGIGIGILAARRPTLRALGFGETDAAGETLATLAGSRDVALGLLPFVLRDDRRALRAVAVLAAAVDAGDALAFAAARKPELRRASVSGLLSAGGAALAGAWAASKL